MEKSSGAHGDEGMKAFTTSLLQRESVREKNRFLKVWTRF